MNALMTCKEASNRTGIPLATILNNCLHGKIPYTKNATVALGENNKPVWLIAEQDLNEYAAQWKPRAESSAWSDADIEALRELYGTCPMDQLAIYLGRSPGAIAMKASMLRKTGSMQTRPKRSTKPFEIPRGGILLAKSCTQCGKIRSAEMFFISNNRRQSECSICRRDKKRGNPGNKPLYQQMSLANADKRYERYTSSEIEIISDPSRPVLALALELKRTYGAISGMRQKLGVSPRGNKTITDRHWVIKYPAADAVLREYYHELGQPVPEHLWDWNE